jgi:hypothetical protein
MSLSSVFEKFRVRLNAVGLIRPVRRHWCTCCLVLAERLAVALLTLDCERLSCSAAGAKGALLCQ